MSTASDPVNSKARRPGHRTRAAPARLDRVFGMADSSKARPGRSGSINRPIEITPVSSFDFLSAEYCELFARSEGTAFQHPIWLDRLYARLLCKGTEPFILTGRNISDGRLVLVLPMVQSRWGPLTMVDAADMRVSDYNAVVVDQEAANCISSTVLSHQELGSPTLMRIRNIRADALDQFGMLGPMRTTFMGFYAHEVAIRPPFLAWREETFAPQFARFLSRKRKRLATKNGVLTFEELREPAAIRHAFALMQDYRARRWANNNLGDERVFEFYVDVACSGYRGGLARTYVLSVDGRPAAILFGLAQRGRFMFLLMGYDRAELRNYSLGLLLLESTIEDCIARGDSIFDLTIGDEPYKFDFGSRRTPILTLWTGLQPLPRLASATFAGVLQFRAWKKKRLTGL